MGKKDKNKEVVITKFKRRYKSETNFIRMRNRIIELEDRIKILEEKK